MNIIYSILLFLIIILVVPYSLYFGLAIKYSNKGSPVKNKSIENDKKTFDEHKSIENDKTSDENKTNKLTMSLIIPTYNEELLIDKKLNNVFKLNYPQDLFEVIIVDSSTDKTVEIIKEHQKRRNIVLIEEKREGLAKALNTAYKAAKNEIVIKTDCDSMLDKDVLKKIAENFSDPTIGGVAGRQAVINDCKVEKDYRSMQSKLQIAESWIDSTVIFHPLSAFRKKLIKPIDTDSLADDTELAVKIRKQGYRTIVDPEILYFEASHSSFFKRRIVKDRRGKGIIRVLLRNKDILFNPKYGYYGYIIYPMNFFMIVLSPYLILIFLIISFIISFQYNPIITLLLSIPMILFIYLGQANKLHIFGPIYAFLDAQISLIMGGLSLVFGEKSEGIWEADNELRNAYLNECE